MSLYQSLLEYYGYNEPIVSSEIEYKSYSRPWIYKEMNKLCDQGMVVRYEKGIYYIPTKTILGTSILDPRKVIEKKYIKDGADIIGYYSGATLLNQLDLSTQMPNTIELYTNNETSRLRNTTVGNQKVVLRRARTPINTSNAAVLCFLELMNSVPASFFDEERKAKVCSFVQRNNISRSDIAQFVKDFPDKVFRTLVESEVIYSVAQ